MVKVAVYERTRVRLQDQPQITLPARLGKESIEQIAAKIETVLKKEDLQEKDFEQMSEWLKDVSKLHSQYKFLELQISEKRKKFLLNSSDYNDTSFRRRNSSIKEIEEDVKGFLVRKFPVAADLAVKALLERDPENPKYKDFERQVDDLRMEMARTQHKKNTTVKGGNSVFARRVRGFT